MDTQELLERGVVEIINKKDLEQKLTSGKKLRVKLGIDPTSPDIHIGRAIPILKLRDFQKLGHQIVFIIGDFTSVIGDASDKDAERPMLTRDEVEHNQKTYFEQVGKLIDLEKAELRRNSEWLSGLGYHEIGEQADQFSVSDFIARENISKRLSSGKRVSLREVLYPLMQGYDSVAIKADVEVGGTDQKFNLLAGRTLQVKYGQEPQNIILNPLVPGLDGRKMSSSWGNTINLNTEPNDMYGKVMSLHDEHIKEYFLLCTRVPVHELEEILKAHPKEAKARLAREITALYHGEEQAQKAEDNFTKVFSNKEIPEDIETITIENKLSETLIKHKFVSSKTEWKRLVREGAVLNLQTKQKLTSEEGPVESGTILKIGKTRFVKLI